MKTWFCRNKEVTIAVVFLAFVAVMVVHSSMTVKSTSNTSENTKNIILRTSMGDDTIQLYDDVPITSGNFKNLTQHGIYDGTIFHRVVCNFVIQGGDASAKGINVSAIPDELPNKHSNVRGSVAMAKTKLTQLCYEPVFHKLE